jgi:hypothetical protein
MLVQRPLALLYGPTRYETSETFRLGVLGVFTISVALSSIDSTNVRTEGS